jgi:hypothetical protein
MLARRRNSPTRVGRRKQGDSSIKATTSASSCVVSPRWVECAWYVEKWRDADQAKIWLSIYCM